MKFGEKIFSGKLVQYTAFKKSHVMKTTQQLGLSS